MRLANLIVMAFAGTLVACINHVNVQCGQDSDCNLSAGGLCTAAAGTVDKWCAYPDLNCPNGYRYSTLDVGDGVSGACVEHSGDAGVDAYEPVVMNGQAAELVLGQQEFTTLDVNHGGASAASLNAASSISVSDDGSLWVFDLGNYRALQWSSAPQANFASAAHVLGHFDFTTATASPTLDARSLTNYEGAISASSGKLIIADGAHNRVLIWNEYPSSSNELANIVLGQSGFTTTTSGTSAAELYLPGAVWTDGTRLAISDGGNNRVLIWNSFPNANRQTADLVLGQASFGSSLHPDPPTASSMYWPKALHYDGNRFYVVDMNNSRVLVWNSFPTINNQQADFVIGQSSLSTGRPGTDAAKLRVPEGIAIAGNSLFVVDRGNNRVMVYSPIPTSSGAAASYVLGQPDFIDNAEGTSQIRLMAPQQAAVLETKLYVTDSLNNRVLRFDLKF